MSINKLIKILSTVDETAELEFGNFVPHPRVPRYINNESASQMRNIAKSIKLFHSSPSEEGLEQLKDKFDLSFLSQLHEQLYVFVNNKTLTTYESENGIVKISAFSGDSWFREIENVDKDYSFTTLQKLSAFYLKLFEEEKELIDPIKKRVLAYSRFMTEEKYYLDFFEFENYYIFTLKNNAILINKDDREQLQLEIKSLRGIGRVISRFFSRFGLAIYLTIIVGTAVYSIQASQIDVIAPYIEFQPYVFEIGDQFNHENVIVNFSDNIDQNNRLIIEYLSEVDITTPNDAEVQFLIRDTLGNSRYQTTTINVVDTTSPLVSNSSVSNRIDYDDFTNFDYLDLISFSDNHIIEDAYYFLPFDLSNDKPLGTYNVQFEVVDQSNNKTVFIRPINIIDDVPPRFNLRSTNVTINYDEQNLFNNLNNVSNVSDNYDSASVRLSFSEDNSPKEPGTYSIVVTAEDQSGNRYSQSYLLTVEDTVNPTIEVRQSLTLDANNVPQFDPKTLVISSGDNHRVESITHSSLDTLRRKTGRVEFFTTASDPSGNKTTVSTIITLIDTTPPVINRLSTFTTIVNRRPVPLSDAQILNMVSVSDFVDPNPRYFWIGDMVVGDTNIITIGAIDSSDNVSTVTVSVRLLDNIAPTLEFIDSGLTLTVDEANASALRFGNPGRDAAALELIEKYEDNVSLTSGIQIVITNTAYDITRIGIVRLRFRIRDEVGNVRFYEYPITTVANPISGG